MLAGAIPNRRSRASAASTCRRAHSDANPSPRNLDLAASRLDGTYPKWANIPRNTDGPKLLCIETTAMTRGVREWCVAYFIVMLDCLMCEKTVLVKV